MTSGWKSSVSTCCNRGNPDIRRLPGWTTSRVTMVTLFFWGLNQYYHRQATTLTKKWMVCNVQIFYVDYLYRYIYIYIHMGMSSWRLSCWSYCHSLGQRQAKVIEELGKLVAFCTRVLLNPDPTESMFNGWTVSCSSPFSLSGGILGHVRKLNQNATKAQPHRRTAVLCSVVHACRRFRECLAKLCGCAQPFWRTAATAAFRRALLKRWAALCGARLASSSRSTRTGSDGCSTESKTGWRWMEVDTQRQWKMLQGSGRSISASIIYGYVGIL